MEKFNDIGGLMGFLSNKNNSSPHIIPETFVERMAAALDDDVYERRHIEKILRGDVTFTENSDPIDGEGRDQKVRDLVEKFQQWRYSERWLFLSAATSDEEKKQRAFEFDSFKKETRIPEGDITAELVEDIKQLYQIISDFIGCNKGYGRPMNILVLGHGSLKCTTHKGKLIVGNGQLAMLVNIEHHGSTKISVDNHEVIKIIYEITKAQQIGQSNRVHLCLFYCYADAKHKGNVFENFKVITYKNGKNPGSLLKTINGELVDSENNALPWFAKERDRQESGEPHNLYPPAETAPVKTSAPETETIFQPSSDGQSGEKDASSIYLTSYDRTFSREVNLSGNLGEWEPPQRNLSVEDPNKERAFGSGKVPNEEIGQGSDTEGENRILSSGTRGGKAGEAFHSVDCSDGVNAGEREEDDEFHSFDCCDGVNESGEKDKKESEFEVCCDGEKSRQTVRSEADRDVSEILSGFQKESMAITHQVNEQPVVEVTSGNQGRDYGRQGWVSRTWGRFKNGFGYLNWYYYMYRY